MPGGIVSSSFRDPSGFVFVRDGNLYRQINFSYQENYKMLTDSGLYRDLTSSGLMVPHEEVPLHLKKTDNAYKVIRPETVPFISYPYEWCFSQLKDAALLTLQIQKTALKYGMSLKDSSAYNIQFVGGKPVFIDVLSFERYREGKPWVAYRQFCQHFLSPLALMKYVDHRFNQWLKIYLDGIPLDLTARLLPFRTNLRVNLLTHIHLHAKSQKHFAGKILKKKGRNFSKLALLGFIDSLENAVNHLKWLPESTHWEKYYTDTNYSSEALAHKKTLVSEFLDTLCPELVWDIGANDGTFSRIASDKRIQTISFDFDHAVIEKSYLETRKNRETHILPLLLDATNPSPDLGWNNQERMSLTERGPCDTLMALALLHHLAISNNVPLVKIASYFSEICRSLIIEWIPKQDPQVQRMLATREDFFHDYTRECFETSFEHHFETVESHAIKDSSRVLYFMNNRRQTSP